LADPDASDIWEGWPQGVGRLVLDETDSTNAAARRRAEEGERGPLWIMAYRQTAGRGRRGRGWSAPEGNLAATLLISPDLTLKDAGFLSIAAALAVGDVLAALAPGAEIAFKWPNDALLNGKKSAGVLLESAAAGDRVNWLAIGIGVNLAAHPDASQLEQGAWPATSVAAEAGAAPAPERALTLLASAMTRWLALHAAEGPLSLRDAWLARAARLGQEITARLPRETVTGVFADMDEQGSLVLDTPLGRRVIAAADVFFE